jgi:hypothetical protein
MKAINDYGRWVSFVTASNRQRSGKFLEWGIRAGNSVALVEISSGKVVVIEPSKLEFQNWSFKNE